MTFEVEIRFINYTHEGYIFPSYMYTIYLSCGLYFVYMSWVYFPKLCMRATSLYGGRLYATGESRIGATLSWSKIMCNPKTCTVNIRGSQSILPPFQGEHLEHAQTSWPSSISPKDKPLSSHMIDRKYPAHPYAPTMIG